MITLKELDELWEGQHNDKRSLKYICRKYGPFVILDWIQRGVSLNNKDELSNWHKNKLKELGKDLIELNREVEEDERLFGEDYGDYFE